MNRVMDVETYAAALRALVPFASKRVAEALREPGNDIDAFVRARDVLRKAAPCGTCNGHRVTGHVRLEGSAPGQDLPIPRPCRACHGAGWTRASLDEHLRAAAGNECPECHDVGHHKMDCGYRWRQATIDAGRGRP